MSSGSRPGASWARFDDLRAGTAVRCPPARRVLVAERPEEVLDVLTEVERATDSGQWAFGYVAYEAAAGLDPQLAVHGSTPMGMPLVWFGLCDEPVGVPSLEPAGAGQAGPARWRPTWTPAEHAQGVRQVQERIAAGDTFQCNLTVRMSGCVPGDPFLLYRDLALSQRGAHNAYLDLGRFVVPSASPELFFERRGDHVLLRPMKGTARRGRHRDEDRRLADRLRSSPKEKAENVMIVDLMRNDIGRVAEIGSVDVPALFSVERYETVLQLTSDVTARLRAGTGLVELFRALFPCGSVTGVPKSSSMEIIRSVEPEPRGVYCGAIGLVGPPDSPVRARFNVAIRTAAIDRTTGEAVYGTGGGITWSSEAAAEHDEVLAKAAVLRASAREFELMETMRYEPRRGLRNRDRHLQRLADSAEHLGFRFDFPAARRVLIARLAGEPAARVRVRLRRAGTLTVDVDPPPGASASPVLLAVDDEPVHPEESWLYHKDEHAGALRPASQPAPGRRGRDHDQHERRAHRGHPGHARGAGRRAVVDASCRVRLSAGRRASGRGCSHSACFARGRFCGLTSTGRRAWPSSVRCAAGETRWSVLHCLLLSSAGWSHRRSKRLR